MAILSVAIEANGWVLAVTGDWSTTPGAWEYSGADRTEGRFLDGAVDQFPLDPNGSPKVLLTVERQGYTRGDGGAAVASSGDLETIVATKAIRKPYPDQLYLDEIDNGDGTRTVRLALSERIYDGDVVAACSFVSGWKAGEAGGSATVGNNSTVALPTAISRFVQPHFQLVRDTTLFTTEVLVASPHPRHFGGLANQPVAAVALYASDGATEVGPFWAELEASDRGDGLVCWRGELELDGLDPGPVSVFHSVYPWVGARREQTRVHSTDTTNGIPVAWDTPLMICYDPDGALYPHRHVYVDAATGSSTASSVTLATTLALAKAGTAAADVQTALQAIHLADFSLPARNGWVADVARAADWCVVTLAEGVQAIGTATVGSGLNCNEGHVVIRGDPDADDPRADCILRTGSSNGVKRVARLWFENLTIEHGEASWGSTGLVHFENVELRGKSGFETATSQAIVDAAQTTGYANFSFCRSTYWKFGRGIGESGARQRTLLMRSSGITRPAAAIVFVNCDKPDDGVYDRYSGTGPGFSGWTNSSCTDAIIWGCRMLAWDGGGFTAVGASESGAGTLGDPTIFRRFAAINNLIETLGPTDYGARVFRLGATPAAMRDSIFEGNTFIGSAFNGFYDGGTDNIASGASAVSLGHTGNVVRNNVIGRHAIKGDIFLKNGTLTGNWQHLYGVGYAANLHGNRNSEPSNFQYAFFGVGSLANTNYDHVFDEPFFEFVDDQSGDSVGWGDYAPDAGSPLLGRAVASNSDVDVFGTARGEVFSSGAVAGDAQAVEVRISGVDSGLVLRSGQPLLHLGMRLGPARAVLRFADSRARLVPLRAARPAEGRRTINVEADDRTLRAGRD